MKDRIMKTLIIENGAYLGGAERSLLTFLKWLPEKDQVAVFSFEKREHHQLYKDIGISVIYPQPTLDKIGVFFSKHCKRGWVIREIFRSLSMVMVIVRNQVLTVHVNFLFDICGFHLSVIKFFRKRVTFHIRSLISQIEITPRTLRCCDVFICISNCVYQQYVTRYPSFHNKFVMAYNGIFSSNSLFIEKKRLPFTFLAPAVLEPRKGLDTAIRAFRKFVDTTSDCSSTLLIAGAAPPAYEDYANSLKQCSKDIGLEDRVLFLGHVEDMKSLYHRANVVLMLSNDGEALGRVGIEAQMMSCLLIGNDLGAVKEYLAHGSTGLVPSENSPEEVAKLMEYAFQNWNDTLDIRKRAFQQAIDKFSIEKTSPILRSIILGIKNT